MLLSVVRVVLFTVVVRAVEAIKLGVVLRGGACLMAVDCGDGMPLSLEGNGMTEAPSEVAVIGLICGDPEDKARKVGEDSESEEDEGEKEERVVGPAWQLTGAVGDGLVLVSVAGLRISETLLATAAGEDFAATCNEVNEEAVTGVLKFLCLAASGCAAAAAGSFVLLLLIAPVEAAGSVLASVCWPTSRPAASFSMFCGADSRFSSRATLFFFPGSPRSVFFRLVSVSLSTSSLPDSFLTCSLGFCVILLSAPILLCLLILVSPVSVQEAHRHFLVCGFKTPAKNQCCIMHVKILFTKC